MGQKRRALEAELRALRAERATVPATPDMPGAPPVMRFGRFGMPEWSVPKPAMRPFEIAKPMPGVLPEGMAADMAQDDAIDYSALAWGSFTDGLQWMGYPYLAELAQRPEYRRISETIAKEMTRKWIKIQSTGSDDGKADKVRHIELAFKRLRVQERVRRAIELDGFFGRGQIFIDTGDTGDSEELRAALVRKPTKIGRGDLKRLTIIEPMWTYAAQYNSSDPLRGDYYRPRSWYVQGRTVHASRLITFVSREVPDLLKPAYSFGGLSMSQMARPYIENWLRTRQSISDLLHSFSVSGIKTNMAAVMQGSIGDGIPSGEDALFRRAQFFNAVRDNRGMMMLDRDTEEYFNVSTPLGTLDHLQAQSQEQMASVSGIPLVVLLGITPSGLNASSEGELQAWNSWIEAQQEQLLARPLTTILEIVQLSEFGEIDPEIGFAFEPLGQLTPEAKATVRKTEADTAAVYIQAGVLSPEEERQRIARDEDSPYASLDLEDSPAPTPPTDPAAEGDPANDDDDLPPRALERPQAPGRQPMGREPMERPTGPGRQPVGRPDLSRAMAGDAGFNESDHPRGQPGNAGQFGSGGSGASLPKPANNRQERLHRALTTGNEFTFKQTLEAIPAKHADRAYAAQLQQAHASGAKPDATPSPAPSKPKVDLASGTQLPAVVYRGFDPEHGNEQRSSMAPGGVYVSTDLDTSKSWGNAKPYEVVKQPKLIDLGDRDGPAMGLVASYLEQSPDEISDEEYRSAIGDIFLQNLFADGLAANGFDGYRLGHDAYLNGDLSDYVKPGKPPAQDAGFNEGDHPRGQPDNAGQFGPGGGGAKKKTTDAKPAPTRDAMHETRSDGKTRTLADGSPLPAHAAALKIPPAWTDVRIAHTPDAPLQATGRDAKGRPQAIYSEEHTAKAAAAKFARIHELQSKFEDVLAQNDKARRDPKTRDVADCLNLIMRMGVRPGSDSDTGASVKAYGATTLEGKHVVRTPDGVRLQFVGKKGVAIDLPVTDPALAANLWARAQKAGQDGRLFGGVTDKSLLDHTHSMDGKNFVTKDFRTRLGTQTAADIVSSMPKPTDRKAYDKAVKTVATAVAKALGNTPAVALTSYISPTVFAPWQLSA